MALSSHALTTVDAVKDFLRLAADDTAYSATLERFINAVSEQVEGYCHRHFESAAYTERCQGSGAEELYLNQYPITAVESVKVSGETILSTEYSIEEQCLYRENIWSVTSKREIEVKYTAGYVLPKDEKTGPPAVFRTLPYDIEDAVIELVAIRFNLRQEDAAGKTSRIQEDFNVRFEKGLPDHIRRVLDPYRRILV